MHVFESVESLGSYLRIMFAHRQALVSCNGTSEMPSSHGILERAEYMWSGPTVISLK